MSEDKPLMEVFKELGKLLQDRNNDLEKLAEECPNEMKLAVTKWAMEKIVEHAKSGGSYRYLIYNRMGFGPEAYAPLCDAGITISNEFDMEQMEKIKEIVKENKYDKLKDTLGLCDEPDCYKDAGSVWPSKNGYRMTCSEHYRLHNKDEW